MAKSENRGRKITQTLSFKLLFSVTIILLVLTLILTALNVLNERRQAQADELRDMNARYTSYLQDVHDLEDKASTLAITIADRPDVKQLFLNRDREGLLTALTPVFNELKADRHVVHLYFEDLDGTVFLRVHNPPQYGDDITYRLTATTVLDTKQTVAGVEIGPNRLGVRAVSPMFDGDTFIGMVEVGVDFDQPFIENLKAAGGADYIMWVTNSAAERPGLKPTEQALTSPSRDLFFYAGTLSSTIPISEDVYSQVLQSGIPSIQYVTSGGQQYVAMIAPLKAYGDRVIGIFEIISSREEFLADVRADTNFAFLVAALVASLGLVGMWYIARVQILQPVSRLSATARRQLEGDLAARVDIQQTDEFGDLADTLNNLSEKLQETIDTLELRVAERTEALERRRVELEIVAEVARDITTVRNLDVLLSLAANLIRERFGYYHVGIFLVDERAEYAVLRAASSVAAGTMLEQKHKLRVGTVGIVGYVASSGTPRIALDVGEDATHFRNPLLPETRSEIGLPLRSRGLTIGVLDIQATLPSAFGQQDIETLQLLADQLVAAIEIAQLAERAENTLKELNAAYQSQTQQGWQRALATQEATALEYDGLQVKPFTHQLPASVFRELEQGKAVVLDEQNMPGGADGHHSANTLLVPLMALNQLVGVLGLEQESPKHIWTPEEIAIAEAAANRAAITLENARLLQDAQRRALKEQTISEISAKIGSLVDLDNILQTTIQELSRNMPDAEVAIQFQANK